MALINYSNIGKTPFQQLLGHNENILKSWNDLANLLSDDGALSKELKEELRRILAQENGCLYCKAKVVLVMNIKMKNHYYVLVLLKFI